MGSVKVFVCLFLICLLFIAPLLVFSVCGDFWLSGFEFRELVTFGFSVNEGVQLNFNVTFDDLGGGCQGDFDDLRFYSLNGTVMGAWNESTVFEDYVEVWLRSDGDGECWLFYGNGSVSDYWDEGEVFDLIVGDAVVSCPVDEGLGSVVYDYSGYGNDGTVYNGEWVENNPFGVGYSYHIRMSGSSIGWLYDTSFVNFNETLSFFYWVFVNDFEAYNGWLLCHPVYGGWYNYVNPDSTIRAYVMNNGTYNLATTGNSPFSENEWVFYGFRWNMSDHVWGFLDGVGGDHNGTCTFEYPLNSTNNIVFSGNGFLNATVCYLFITSEFIADSDWVVLAESFPDLTLVEGSVVCREWVAVMPDVVFGSDYYDIGEVDDLIFGVLVLFMGFVFMVGVVVVRRRV